MVNVVNFPWAHSRERVIFSLFSVPNESLFKEKEIAMISEFQRMRGGRDGKFTMFTMLTPSLNNRSR